MASAAGRRCLGLPKFKNTNRDDPKYIKRANRKARRYGFTSAEAMVATLGFLKRAEASLKAELINDIQEDLNGVRADGPAAEAP